MTAPESRQELAKRGTADKAGDSYRAVDMQDYLDLTEALKASPMRMQGPAFWAGSGLFEFFEEF